LAIIALHSLLEYPLWYGPFQLATVLCLWLLWRTRRGAPAGAPRPGWPGAEPLRLAVATAMLATVAWVGWDYWRVGQLFMPQALRAEAYREDTLAKVQDSWWFRDTVRFARVTTTPPSPDNAVALYADALQALHYSPEPRVIGTLLECARLLGLESASTAHIRRQWQVVYGRADDGTPESLPNQ
jgi:hypothetical protein